MNKIFLYAIIYLIGVIISSFSQVLLKKSANTKKDNIIKEYLNTKTIVAYSIFFIATLCSVIAYKNLPLSSGPIIGALEYIFVIILSYIILKEKINKRTIIGISLIILGIVVYSIKI